MVCTGGYVQTLLPLRGPHPVARPTANAARGDERNCTLALPSEKLPSHAAHREPEEMRKLASFHQALAFEDDNGSFGGTRKSLVTARAATASGGEIKPQDKTYGQRHPVTAWTEVNQLRSSSREQKKARGRMDRRLSGISPRSVKRRWIRSGGKTNMKNPV